MEQPPHDTAGTEKQDYEFNELQNVTLRVLASRMKLVGIFYIAIGGLIAAVGFLVLFFLPGAGIVYMLLAIPNLVIGIWTSTASSSFRLIVETKGYDIDHLMNALEALRKLYTLQFWMLIISIAFVLLVILVGIIVGLSNFLPIGQQASYTFLH